MPTILPSAAVAVVPRFRIGPSALAPQPVAPGLAIWPRDAWAPGPPTGPLAAEEVRFLLVHHTAGDTDHRAEQVPSILASMYAVHTGAKGWLMSPCSGHGFKFGALMGLELARTLATNRDPAAHARWAAGLESDIHVSVQVPFPTRGRGARRR